MKKMLFETSLKGHRMEYIHHLYIGMIECPEDEFIIVVPETFKQRKSLYKWPEAHHIRFIFIPDSIEKNNGFGTFSQSFRRTRVLRHYVKQEGIDCVFLIVLMAFIPALGILLPRGVKVSGIIYKVYLYEWKDSSIRSRIQNVAKYLVMRFSPCLKTIFVLNDASSAAQLNKLYRTDKFTFITDPYNVIDYTPRSIRSELGVKDEEKIFLHFGGLNRRKGTLEILKALALLPECERKKSLFVFAGKVYEPIKAEFYGLVESLDRNIRIIVYDQFCSNEQLADLCYSSDYLLMPYRNTSQSSGLLGYAAHFGIPVIGPKDGLIGKLIRKNHLGVQLDVITSEEIAKAICTVEPYRIKTSYNERISVDRFRDEIFERF